jgi:hypothetical protein
MFAMTDPIYPLMLMGYFKNRYYVWDKAGSINFIKPGKGKLVAEFNLSDAKLASSWRRPTGEKHFPEFEVRCRMAGRAGGPGSAPLCQIQAPAQRLNACCRCNKGPVGALLHEEEIRSLQLAQAHLFVQLFAPALDALGSQLGLAIFVDAQAHEVLCIHERLGGFELVARGRPVADDDGALGFDDVTQGAHGVEEVLGIVFLIAASEDGHQLVVEVDLFEFGEEVVPSAWASP